MLALVKNSKLIHQSNWNLKLKTLCGLQGNSSPPNLPYECDDGTLYRVEIVKSELKTFQDHHIKDSKVEDGIFKTFLISRNIALGSAKSIALTTLAQTRFTVETGGIIHDQNYFKTDRESQSKIAHMTAGKFKCNGVTDGVVAAVRFVDLGDSEVSALKAAVRAHVQRAYDNEAKLMSEVESASTVTALRNVNISGGWDEIPI